MRTRWLVALVMLCSLLVSSSVVAKYARPELEKVPVERVLKNLAERAAEKPDDALLQFNLARAYAMAYATKASEVDIRQGSGDVWYGFEPAHVPFKNVATDDKARQAAAQENLAKAIKAYEAGVKLAPENLVGRLGLAWCLEQAGKTEAAIAGYRHVIEEGWKQEGGLTRAGLGFHSLVAEAGQYLTPLLDPRRDADEIAEIKKRSEHIQNSVRRPVTPIAVPLKPGLTASDLEDWSASVLFDADGSGEAKAWTWLRPNAGWLVIDRAGSGKIDSALQMFGSVTFWMFWKHGYEPLAVLDDNRDGELRGAELAGLAIWHDANQNGRSDPSEVLPLAEHGIVALSCQHELDATHPDRIPFSRHGVLFANGTTRPSFDLQLHPAGKR